MKRIIALILVVVLTASALSVTALASYGSDYDEGYYKDKYYYAHFSTSGGTSAVGTFSWRGVGTIKCTVTIKSHDINKPFNTQRNSSTNSAHAPNQTVRTTHTTPYNYILDYTYADYFVDGKTVVELSAWS